MLSASRSRERQEDSESGGDSEFGVLQYGFGFLVYVSLLLKFTILIAICKLHLGCCLG